VNLRHDSVKVHKLTGGELDVKEPHLFD